MAENVNCPHCGQLLQIPQDAGTSIFSCPNCEGQIEVPAAPEPDVIYCARCGQENRRSAPRCARCGFELERGLAQGAASGQPPGSTGPGADVPNYLVQSILCTLCCCMPLGIVALVFSSQVNGKLASGDLTGAREASGRAKLFCWLSFGLGFALIAVYLLIGIIQAAAESGY